MNSNLTITIAAPELVNAINSLAQALVSRAPLQSAALVDAQAQPQKPATPITTPQTPQTPQTPAAPAQAQVPTAAPAYTLESLQTAVAPLIDAGKRSDLVQLLNQFGVQALTQLPKERYGEFATALRQLGAKI